MPANEILTQLEFPVEVEGVEQNVVFDIQDAGARELIEALGNAVKWIGVTTTELTDGATTNPITINSESVTADTGDMTQYSGEEFVWNGSAWQSIGKNNFGALAFKSSATGSITPAGSVSVTQGNDTTTSVTPMDTAGSLPAWTVSGTKATFSPGSLPTAGSAVTVVTAAGTVSATFTGTADTVTVS